MAIAIRKALDTLNDKEFGKLFAEKEIFDKMGLEHQHPDAGCCGMAGAFGYEKVNDHYEVGVAAGERVLLPEVRKAADDELIVADGFSCQEQIEQQTDRVALHIGAGFATRHVTAPTPCRRARPKRRWSPSAAAPSARGMTRRRRSRLGARTTGRRLGPVGDCRRTKRIRTREAKL